MNTQKTELNRILEIIGKIAKISADGDYIYRGEPECYKEISSTLYRQLARLCLHFACFLSVLMQDTQNRETELLTYSNVNTT